MKILILTQKVDYNDGVLGFFHNWLKKLAERFEYITVICLEKGDCDLPANVEVLSLGKESGNGRFTYMRLFYKYILQTKKNYDAVLVHMNPEYVVLGAWLWKLWGKKIALWYNHSYGDTKATAAINLAHKVFFTSPYAFATGFEKAQAMPVGIDTEQFNPQDIKSASSSFKILSIGRISPVKNVDTLIKAAHILEQDKFDFVVHIYGDAPSRDKMYFNTVKESASDLIKKGRVVFHKGIANIKTPGVYNQHDLFVNLTPSGSFDKTILESMSCKVPILICNKSLGNFLSNDFLFEENDTKDLVRKIKHLAGKDLQSQQDNFRKYVIEKHSLRALIEKFYQAFKK
ncbi:glycosyltransferase family 4 protein [Candidatus Parcubacteria bacterium]|jgi:glycosyltransferase involved in cell wall biosynthesis|nr:glycosyltransferase family 4 protein [Candidatus Parcubacteria bacterium]